MAATKTLIRSGAMSGEPLDHLMTRINAEIEESNSEFMFATVWIGSLDVRTGEVQFVNAGHNPPLLRHRDGSAEYLREMHGPFIGPVQGATYTTGTFTIVPGDRLVVYSDGVTEAMAPDEALFGEDQLMSLDLPAAADDATADIVSKVMSWEEGTRSDDVTVLVLDFYRKREEQSLIISIDELDPAIAVSGAVAQVGQFGIQQSLDESIVAKVQMALDEIVVNVLTHGSASHVTIELALIGHHLVTTVIDDGVPFDPLSAPIPDTDTSLEDRELGGLGIHLVRETMDEVTYTYRDGVNILEMTLAVST
jgi:sigma-B regulation protein RsbU (phosphoserine phosphatase)